MQLFLSNNFDQEYYQFKANYTYGNESFDWDNSNTTWQNMSDTMKKLLTKFNHTPNNNFAACDIRILVPLDEPWGSKSSSVVFYASE